MSSHKRQISARDNSGNEVHVAEVHSDFPVLDFKSMERLQAVRPDALDFFMSETKKESDFRRSETHRVNSFRFIERLMGMGIALLICLFAIFGSFYALNSGGENLAIAIVTLSIGTLAVTYLKRK